MTELTRTSPTSASTRSIRILHTLFGVIIGIAIAVWTPGSFSWVDRTMIGDLPRGAPFNLKGLTIPRQEIVPGGPGKDGIPSLTEPHVIAIASAPDLTPQDRVIGLDIAGERRAYPLRLLDYHEVVNDTLGGTPIVVVYCPLCDSVTVADRRIGRRTLSFGVSGLLYNSNVLLYDHQNDALWSQLGFRAVSGPLAGRALDHLPWELTTVERWAARYPDSTIASFETGYGRAYHTSPYESYFQEDRLILFPVKHRDDRLAAKEPVIGLRIGNVARAYAVAAVRAAGGRLEESFRSGRLVMVASDDGESVAVTEVPDGAHVAHTFWFSWSAFHPETELVDTPDH